tara:strand:- start:156 stop:905 length:750 start_codon:yes stop_codon:yes gene_type:complete
MLVTLGTNSAIGAGGSVTFPYACRSVQKVFIKVDDPSGTDAFSHSVTIQLGQRTIANGCSAYGLLGMSTLQSHGLGTTTEIYYQIDLGSHQLLDNENLYVTVNASAAIDAVDVSALVDQPTAGEMPVRYTEYSDNVFTAENVLIAMSYDNARATVDEDAYNIEIRNSVSSSSPSLISCNNWYGTTAFSEAFRSGFGLLVNERLPLTTTFNYSSSAVTDRILIASQMGTNNRAIRQGQRAKAIANSQVGK